MSSLDTELCRLLGIDHPVLSAGIGGGARAELVGAVSDAGGFGVLGASGMEPDAIRAEIGRIRALTDRPFGINVIIAEDYGNAEEDREFFRAQFRAAAEAGATAVVLFWGDPAPLVDEAHALGLKVLIQVGSVEEAEAAAAAGVDAVIAQGVEVGAPSPVRPWSGPVTQPGWRPRTSTGISTTPRCGRASRARWSTTSSRRARSFTSSFAMPRQRSASYRQWPVSSQTPLP